MIYEDRPQYCLVPFPLVEAMMTGTLSRNAMALYVALDRYRNKHTGKAWPGQCRLASDIGMSRPTIHNLLTELEKGGFIRIEKPTNKRESYQYALLYAPRCKESLQRNADSMSTRGQFDVSSMSASSLHEPSEPSEPSEPTREDCPPTAGTSPFPTPKGKRTTEQIQFTADVDEGLAVWDRELAVRGFAVPARNFGRDRKIFGELVKGYGIPEVAETMRVWLDYRKRERSDATIIGFRSAFERTWQRRHGK